MVNLTSSPQSWLRIVTIENSAVVAARLKSIVSATGNVLYMGNAFDGSDAVSLVRDTKPHIVTLDLNLDDSESIGTRLELLTRLKQINPLLIIIVLTNAVEPAHKTKCLQAGASYFLDKTNEFHSIGNIIEVEYQRSLTANNPIDGQ